MRPRLFENPSVAAKNAIAPTGTYQGYTFVARLNGAIYADVSEGVAVAPSVAMSHDSIIHLASCSKVICHAALLAMIEDWGTLAAAVTAAGTTSAAAPALWTTIDVTTSTLEPLLPPQRLPLPPPTAPTEPPKTVPHTASLEVPIWALPLLAYRPLAQSFSNALLDSLLPLAVAYAVQNVANGIAYATIPPAVGSDVAAVPGYIGFLTKIHAGVTVPTMSTEFMTLLGSRMQATYAQLQPPLPYPTPPPNFTLTQLINHTTTLHYDTLSASIVAAIPAATYAEPPGAQCVFNVWAHVLGILMDTPSPNPGLQFQYNDNNYAVVGAVIAECAAMDYDAYAIQRLLSDPRFSTITAGPGLAPQTLYYAGAPSFGPGVEACVYTGACSGAGGFSACGAQYTDWITAVYTCDPTVKNWAGVAEPILSAADSAALFAKDSPTLPDYWDYWAAPDATTGWTVVDKTGGTTFYTATASGSPNTVIGFAVSPDQKNVLVAFFGTNCSIDAWPAWFAAAIATVQVYIANNG